MYKAIIIGSGCAGLACAARLGPLTAGRIAVMTEDINGGTSRNTGSDKQTYYKLSIGGDSQDSVTRLASDFYEGGGINGELALTEAAGSARAFLYLCELGVKFPTNEYGEYIGYMTDHDTRRRAVSCGPLTSKYMTEILHAEVKRQNIEIFNYLRAVKLIIENNTVLGAVFIDTRTDELVKIDAENVVLATGGEASLYEKNVFPNSQWGGMGLLCEAGATLHNMNCWQYGIASTDIKWNLSGSYQQALPRYVSIDKDKNVAELLPKYITNSADALNRVFLKGYQWPFDVNKLNGSSYIDAAVFYETEVLGNTVYLDYTQNPSGLENGFGALCAECVSYLKNCKALFDTPVKRLRAINEKAYQLFLSHNIDLTKDLLKIDVCAQHQNGGAAVNADYETCVNGLFAIGEAAGVFGAYRPGGSALNSTQVGALRAAVRVSKRSEGIIISDDKTVSELSASLINARRNNGVNHTKLLGEIKKRMSRSVSLVRDTAEMEALYKELLPLAESYFEKVSAQDGTFLAYLKTRDTLLCACRVLSAALTSAREQGSQGGAIVCKKQEILTAGVYRREENLKKIVETKGCESLLKEPSPIPERELWFENLL